MTMYCAKKKLSSYLFATFFKEFGNTFASKDINILYTGYKIVKRALLMVSTIFIEKLFSPDRILG